MPISEEIRWRQMLPDVFEDNFLRLKLSNSDTVLYEVIINIAFTV